VALPFRFSLPSLCSSERKLDFSAQQIDGYINHVPVREKAIDIPYGILNRIFCADKSILFIVCIF
jgi:hypothetical protein